VTEAYAAALEQGRLSEAYALLDPAQRESEDQFRARYATEGLRQQRAAQLRASLQEGGLQVVGTHHSLVNRDGWRVVEQGAGDARQALRGFLEAVEQGDFARAYAQLAGEWRAQYTPERFEADFKAEPLARERLARARAALDANAPAHHAGAVLFPIGGGKAVRLVLEGGAFRVAALE